MDFICPRVLEKAFLDAGFGARALSRAGSTVIKLCEKPSKKLLGELKSRRQESATPASWKVARAALENRTGGVSQSPGTKGDCFHFPNDVGIQCEITFGGHLSLHNTELLRCYAICDKRVRQVGIFVKMWAKKRRINSPHCGTLSSDAYVLMVLHYLMNVVQPPVVPNLQAMAKEHPKQSEISIVDGWSVQYYRSERNLKTRAKMNAICRNRQSVGELLPGFFAYYGSHGRHSPFGGFHWANNTISIRTPNGILPKREKGWTAAKTDSSGNRIHFLLAIEDPFQHDRNLAASVTNIGLNAIKTEFRRAQTIITHIQEIPGAGWEWRNREGDIGQDLLAEFQSLSSSQQQSCDRDNRSSKSLIDPHDQLANDQSQWNASRSSASCTRDPPSSLIRPTVTAEKLEQQAHRQGFRRQTALVASTMRRMLCMPEDQGIDGAITSSDIPRQSSDKSPSETRVVPIPAHADTSSKKLSSHHLAASATPSGKPKQAGSVRSLKLTLDSRQFHGPSAIRDRIPSLRQQRHASGSCGSEFDAMDSDTSSEA